MFLFDCEPGRIGHGDLKDSNFDKDRQPEMATETGNTYISETMKDSIKTSTANLGFTIM